VVGPDVWEGKLSLLSALRKTWLFPAPILQKSVPQMKDKGRIRVGADADITIFDAAALRQ
jgi:N-acyl-D-glutamate deacylase